MKEFDIFKNPSEEEYNEITEAVKLNDDYCPCMSSKSDDTKCMCKLFRDSKETDFCHCGRFYKVKNYETIALIGDTSEDEGTVNYMSWYEKMMNQDFIVLGIPLDLYDINCGSEEHFNLCKSIVAKSDAVVVLGHNQKLYSMITDLIEWASSINKKVLTREDLVK
jgi:hypothetical protein